MPDLVSALATTIRGSPRSNRSSSGLYLPLAVLLRITHPHTRGFLTPRSLISFHPLNRYPCSPSPPPFAMCPILNRIDPTQLETSLPKRVEYITKFIEFGPEDAAALRAAAPIVKQITNCAVDAVYEKLFSFDVTRATFLSRNTGFEGKLATRLEEITHDNDQIKFRWVTFLRDRIRFLHVKFDPRSTYKYNTPSSIQTLPGSLRSIRKDFLRIWMFKVFTADYTDVKTFEYLDKVGLMHTGPVAFQHLEKKEPLHVDYMHCALLLGHVHNMLTRAVLARNLPAETTETTLIAINKVLWIQNDLFARHYIPPRHSHQEEAEAKDKGASQGWGWGLFGRSGGSSSSS
ncbi:unnamed protein product [Rhizoctonia solani]|uniref:Globin-sensor domain-containing protein n=1 Tax=Rhizoctonia solani TaxID=456999 RepID=A0A8H2XYU2_9AGAM|nr:unnamed protein product [Rhizoctonia solani]